jgi:hypothetical protein
MISRVKIEDASDTLEDVAIESLVAILRTTQRYKDNPSYYSTFKAKLLEVDGTIQAQQVNAALDELETLGIGEVQLNQSQTVGTDGVIYSQSLERQALVDYILGILYEGYQPSVYVDPDSDSFIIKGNYASGRHTVEFEGYL